MNDARPAASTLRIAAALDRPLVNAAGDSVRFLAVEVEAPTVEAARAPKAPLNLALVVDASGSMQGEPIEAAKEAARRVTERLGAADTLSVVSFDTRVHLHVDRRRQDALGQAEARTAIAALRAGSSTNLSGGWLEGCRCVAQAMEAEPGLRNHVVLLSDGMANVGLLAPDELASHAAELRARGLVSSAVGIGEHYSDTQLEAIAASGGGRLHHAAEAPEIGQLVLGELEELRATVVESCDLLLELPAGVRAEAVGDWATTRQGQRLACVVGALASADRRTVVFKLTCPAGPAGERLRFDVTARWRPVGDAAAVETPLQTVTLEFSRAREIAAQPRDLEVAVRVAKAWQNAIVRTATRLNQDGALERAAAFVSQELRYFVRYCQGLPGGDALVRPLERLRAAVGEQRFDGHRAKEMYIASVKSSRSQRELRSGKAGTWDDHLPE